MSLSLSSQYSELLPKFLIFDDEFPADAIHSNESAFVGTPEKKLAKKVLIIEDDLVIQRLHKGYLELMKFDAVVAETGQTTLEKLDGSFDLILLDIGLPDINGIQLAQTIRKQYSNEQLPIIALTAHAKDIEHECLAAGIDAILHKPIGIELLQKVIKFWLKK